MQEIVVVSYCDRCYQTGKNKIGAGDAVEVAIGKHKARLDLCDQCDRELLDPVRALVRSREAAQRALDKSAGTNGREPRGARSQSGPLARCGQCDARVQIGNRGTHARARHNGADPQDLTWHFDDVDTVSSCSCGLTFPTEHGRNTHARRSGHTSLDDTQPRPVAD